MIAMRWLKLVLLVILEPGQLTSARWSFDHYVARFGLSAYWYLRNKNSLQRCIVQGSLVISVLGILMAIYARVTL